MCRVELDSIMTTMLLFSTSSSRLLLLDVVFNQDVASECSARLVFKCPNTDLDYWDFGDQPECNNLGYPIDEDSSPQSPVIASALVYITVFIATLIALVL